MPLYSRAIKSVVHLSFAINILPFSPTRTTEIRTPPFVRTTRKLEKLLGVALTKQRRIVVINNWTSMGHRLVGGGNEPFQKNVYGPSLVGELFQKNSPAFAYSV